MPPVQITFHGIQHSDALADYVQKKADKLTVLSERLTHCRVALEIPHKHNHTGNAVRVRIDLGFPESPIFIDRHHKTDAQNDAYAAVDVAFDDAERALRESTRWQRRDRKSDTVRERT
jgi:ribosome-associated translation inhibitor RaiA